eukprot:CAMPEP_0183529860 /NCGR_PEP_ID=MMETSP0371-20130417/23707_1 /TAXON_ID=268820 /ORGANISM="Peridinium aciculiferum, Strain PAER-2" /LENGTH=56 /DNA_ID=CAMNT_0025729669 /DNA_START=191 /DNA_END=361 /DNA_ORIENTATION=+
MSSAAAAAAKISSTTSAACASDWASDAICSLTKSKASATQGVSMYAALSAMSAATA